MQQHEKLKAVQLALGREEFKKNNEFIFFCKNPLGCNGKHHNAKLSVNIKTDSFNCWVCGFSGKSLIGVLKLGNRDLFLRYINDIKGKSSEEKEERLFDTPILPEKFAFLGSSFKKKEVLHDPHWRSALRYLKERGIGRREIFKYKLGFCTEGEYRFRIIVPSFDVDGELNFFVGRKFYDNVGVSYKHGMFDKNIIFNDYMIDWEKPITLVEGPFDMMKAGNNSIPLQGSELPDKLFGKIVSFRTPVYIALDADAKKKQIKHAKKLLSFGVEVFNVDVSKFGVNDVGEMTMEQFETAKKSAKRINGDLDLLRMRVSA